MNKKNKPLITFFVIFAIVLLSLNIFQLCFDVSAAVGPLKIFIDEIEFGTVFPEESLEKEFNIDLDPSWQEGTVQYKISQNIKPIEEGYEEDEDPDNPGYYRNLCDYLTELRSYEEENDTMNLAYLNSDDDTSDSWHFTLNVPCIKGSEGQDWEGGPVIEKGVYGCDLVIEVESESEPEPPAPPPAISGGGGYIPPTYKATIVYNYPLEKTVNTEVQETIIISNTGSAVLTNGILKITFPPDYLTINGDSSGVIVFNAPGISVGSDWQVDFNVLPIKNGKDIITEAEFKADGNVDISAKSTETIGIVSGEEYVPPYIPSKEKIVAGAEEVIEKIKVKVGPDLWISFIIAVILTGLFWNRSLFRK